MSRTATIAVLGLLLTGGTASADSAQVERPSLDKKTIEVHASAVLPFDSATVWQAVAQDYGRIADSHPRIVKSEYRHGSLQGELGAERTCWFNESGSQLLHEQVVGWDDEAMRMENRVLEAARFPIDPDNSLGVYTVEDLGDGTSRFNVDFTFRTKPAMMGGMMKSQFERLMADYFVALEHHLETGEVVNKDNFKAIAKARR